MAPLCLSKPSRQPFLLQSWNSSDALVAAATTGCRRSVSTAMLPRMRRLLSPVTTDSVRERDAGPACDSKPCGYTRTGSLSLALLSLSARWREEEAGVYGQALAASGDGSLSLLLRRGEGQRGLKRQQRTSHWKFSLDS